MSFPDFLWLPSQERVLHHVGETLWSPQLPKSIQRDFSDLEYFYKQLGRPGPLRQFPNSFEHPLTQADNRNFFFIDTNYAALIEPINNQAFQIISQLPNGDIQRHFLFHLRKAREFSEIVGGSRSSVMFVDGPVGKAIADLRP